MNNKFRHYEYIFSIVIYKNTNDVKECLDSIKKNMKRSYRIILVNNYCDDISLLEAKKIAVTYDCDFIESFNNGYSAGNNLAITFALEKYTFRYLIISNPDIVIQKWDDEILDKNYDVYAPEISTLSGNKQNPMWIWNLRLANHLIYYGMKNNNNFSFLLGIGINKVIKTIARFLWSKKNSKNHRIYEAHGSFIIISYKVIEKLNPFYDDKMFLFAEESYLAYKLKEKGFITVYNRSIEIFHKCDGSMKFRNDINDQLKKANIYFYENYYFHV